MAETKLPPPAKLVYPHYVSTACIHEQHEDCVRGACRFCHARCRCGCHRVTERNP